MVPNSEKLIEVFIGGLPRSIEGNVTSSKPQTLEEVITITQRLIEQVINTNLHKKPMITNENLKIEETPPGSILREKFASVHFRISTLKTTLEDVQVRHQLYTKNLLNHTS
nr:reverse transcriptase domain-containing protein [Tanacetum cinerariifolium]